MVAWRHHEVVLFGKHSDQHSCVGVVGRSLPLAGGGGDAWAIYAGETLESFDLDPYHFPLAEHGQRRGVVVDSGEDGDVDCEHVDCGKDDP